jgi:hypothetical protein
MAKRNPSSKRNSSPSDRVLMRRKVVADLRLAGLSEQRIVRELELLSVNPKASRWGLFDEDSGEWRAPIGALDQHGKPWAKTTVHRDLTDLKEDWRARAKKSTDDHIARQFALIDDGIEQGIAKQDPELVLKYLKRQAELLGLDKPQQIETKDTTLEHGIVPMPTEADQ